MIVSLLGGIGLFLLGMTLLTDGLKTLAGDALRRVLSKFVKGPFTALSSGTLVTVLVQSSSATTLATIGFVSAGILTFPQTIGVLLGAKLGTTSTGWIVAALGLRFSISALALPIVGVGALMRLLSKGKLAHAGLALAGFGLIFIGIDTLQTGMEQFRDVIDLSAYSGKSVSGILLLVLTGIVMTVIMQSSSAAVATTLTALFAGAVDINQAAALVIGQNFGTAITAIFAIIGASTAAVRTGVIFILFSGIIIVIALALMPLYIWYVELNNLTSEPGNAAMSIAAFHTLFNLMGIIIIMPFRDYLSRLVESWIPEKEQTLLSHLDKSVLSVPSVAIEAVNLTLKEIHTEMLNFISNTISKPDVTHSRKTLLQAEIALDETNKFLSEITIDSSQKRDYNRYLANLHAIDHAFRFMDACKESTLTKTISRDEELQKMAEKLSDSIIVSQKWLLTEQHKDPSKFLKKTSSYLAKVRKKRRSQQLETAAREGHKSTDTLALLDTVRWIDRLAYHNWRAMYHLMDLAEYESDPPYPG